MVKTDPEQIKCLEYERRTSSLIINTIKCLTKLSQIKLNYINIKFYKLN